MFVNDARHAPWLMTSREDLAPAEAFLRYKSLLGSSLWQFELFSDYTCATAESSEVPRKTAYCGRMESKDFEAAFASLASSYGAWGLLRGSLCLRPLTTFLI
ncbi:hypothetical protein BU15DRAFT_62084 [Melanogaster broomeanus]|nr:hypothetical protein BU15DRAFT_62084 [Melanogaster broomeanus]